MPTTQAGLPYPGPTDPLSQLDAQLAALAGAAIGDLVTLTPTMATGWTLSSCRGRKLGTALAWLELVATRATGAAVITAPANGDMPNVAVATLPAGWFPTNRNIFLPAWRDGGGMWSTVVTSTTGQLSVAAGVPTATISPADVLTASAMVPLA